MSSIAPTAVQMEKHHEGEQDLTDKNRGPEKHPLRDSNTQGGEVNTSIPRLQDYSNQTKSV